MHARFLLKVCTIRPFVASFGKKVFLELGDGFVLVKKVFDLSREIFGSESAMLGPKSILLAALPLKKLNHDVSSLLSLII